MVDLNELIDKNLNYNLLEAIDINDHDQIICLAKIWLITIIILSRSVQNVNTIDMDDLLTCQSFKI